MNKLRQWLIGSCVILLFSASIAVLFSVWVANENKKQWDAVFDRTHEQAGRLKTYKTLQHLIKSGDFVQAQELVDFLVWAQDDRIQSLLLIENVSEKNQNKLRESIEYQPVAKPKPNKPLN